MSITENLRIEDIYWRPLSVFEKIGSMKKLITLIFTLLLSLSAGAKTMSKEVATLAGGCFWGMEEIIRAIPGVLETNVGYAGGSVDSPTYNIVKLGTSGRAVS